MSAVMASTTIIIISKSKRGREFRTNAITFIIRYTHFVTNLFCIFVFQIVNSFYVVSFSSTISSCRLHLWAKERGGGIGLNVIGNNSSFPPAELYPTCILEDEVRRRGKRKSLEAKWNSAGRRNRGNATFSEVTSRCFFLYIYFLISGVRAITPADVESFSPREGVHPSQCVTEATRNSRPERNVVGREGNSSSVSNEIGLLPRRR